MWTRTIWSHDGAGLPGFQLSFVALFMFGLYMWASEPFMATVCVHNQNEDLTSDQIARGHAHSRTEIKRQVFLSSNFDFFRIFRPFLVWMHA